VSFKLFRLDEIDTPVKTEIGVYLYFFVNDFSYKEKNSKLKKGKN